jgi:hypothetical protein
MPTSRAIGIEPTSGGTEQEQEHQQQQEPILRLYLPPNEGKRLFAICAIILGMDTAPDFSTLHNTALQTATDTLQTATDTLQTATDTPEAAQCPHAPLSHPHAPLSAPQWLYLLSRLSPAALDEVKAALSSLESCAGRQPRA